MSMEAQEPKAAACMRCRKDRDGPNAALVLRKEAVCPACFAHFISTKTIKRLELLNRDLHLARGRHAAARRKYLVGLALAGAASTALVDILARNVDAQIARGRGAPLDLVVVAVDLDLGLDIPSLSPLCPSPHPPADELLNRFRQRYPRFRFERIPLTQAMALKSIDWTALLPDNNQQGMGGKDEDGNENECQNSPTTPPQHNHHHRLTVLLTSLPDPSARADIISLLVRKLLLAAAARHTCRAVLLGHSTTALAELVLAETASGRGAGLVRMVEDGEVWEADFEGEGNHKKEGEVEEEEEEKERKEEEGGRSRSGRRIPIYYPLRELSRSELRTYVTNVATPGLGELMGDAEEGGVGEGGAMGRSAVVSYRDMSIAEVTRRYLEDVEKSYPSIVANVVRTTGKLGRGE